MTAKEDLKTGAVTVIYTSTHTSHTLGLSECKHLPLPRSVTTRVKTLLARGVQMEKVMDGMVWLYVVFMKV